ncbi:hypothetical protein PF002_g26158 [Phytophthora fragariae]|nr:hypothetical protein PF009_g28244 [Phytophthora fragariae]KAE9075621.1 hypothetical protein PF006_g28299 [Phytophthora fragariae]KAE9185466.1 hypothetical protein PF002_g26158 [Phytophthora fragariae]KAE9271704.1 hypothetical protein PF001_g28260 [Phytophthora fragariae]
MRSRHGAVLDHFNGTGCRASRNSTSILRKVGAAPVDETTMIPVFDFSRCCVQSTSLKYVLDFSYYHGNSRRRPQSVILGATILDEPQRATATATQVQETLGVVEEEVTGLAAAQTTLAPCTPSAARTEFLPGQLSDSDDSDWEETDPAPLQEVTLLPSAERKRPLEVAMTDSGETASLKLLKRSYSDNPSMLRSIDQLIALRASTVSAGAVSDVIGPTISSSGKSKQQFQPSVLQRSIHRHLVTGTYALMDAQLLLETLQVQHLLFAFLLHPAILRALFRWEFGLRGLSVMHFAPVTESFRRDYAASHDMADFSRAAVLPAARNPTELCCIIDALDGLDSVVSRVYLPYVSELVMAARKMVVRLKSQEGFSNHVARKELVYWINERFEQFRGFLALNRIEEALSICAQFSAADSSFVRVTQIITAASIAELRQLQQTQPMAKQPPAPGPQNTKHLKAKPPASDDRPPVPQAVLTALPRLIGKSLCMRYLSNLPCPSRLDRCYARRRGHFNPGSLPAIVYDFIRDTYGGLKKDFRRSPASQPNNEGARE